jgi:hypothetical protein
MLSSAMAQYYMRYGYMYKEYMRVATSPRTSRRSVLRIRTIDLKMGAMRKPRPNKAFPPPDDRIFPGKRRKAVPYEFVLDALANLPTETRTMFGCLAVYLGDKIVLILRDRRDNAVDNGVWIATTEEHHTSLGREFPNMRSIQLFGERTTGWQVLPADAPDFEQAALHACELIVARDPRIGKVPKSRQKTIAKTAAQTKRRI